jgi:hypothetical protein
LTPGTVLRICLGIVATQAVYAAALAVALLLRRVDWRGATYRVGGPWKIRLLADPPYAAVAAQAQTMESL